MRCFAGYRKQPDVDFSAGHQENARRWPRLEDGCLREQSYSARLLVSRCVQRELLWTRMFRDLYPTWRQIWPFHMLSECVESLSTWVERGILPNRSPKPRSVIIRDWCTVAHITITRISTHKLKSLSLERNRVKQTVHSHLRLLSDKYITALRITEQKLHHCSHEQMLVCRLAHSPVH